MSKARKISLWGACGAGVLLVLATGAVLIFSYLFNTGQIGGDLKTVLETRYHIETRQIRINFRPLPLVTVRGVKTVIAGKLEARVGTVFIRLKVLPLFRGKLEPSTIELLSPVITVKLPPLPTGGFSFQGFEQILKDIFGPGASLPNKIGQTAVFARNGDIHIFGPKTRCFFFNHIDLTSTVRNDGLDFVLASGKSSFWQTLSLKGFIGPEMKAWGKLDLTGVPPGRILRALAPSATGRLGGYVSDITAGLYYNGCGNFRADFTASVPSFVFGIAQRTMTIQDGFLAGVMLSDAKGIDVSFSDLRFGQPHLALTASFKKTYSDGSYSLSLEGRDTDAATLRTILLAVNKKTKGVRHFFEILREGIIPRISFSSHANDISRLLKLESMTTKCSVEKAVVMAPKVDLLVSNVSGDILIENGILTATRISGQTRGSSTRDGKLTVGLPHDDHLLRLELPFEADLSELPAILGRVAKSKAFKKELALISDVTGKTEGRLVVGDRVGALAVNVLTGPFSLSCRYGRLAGPVFLRGASFKMDKDTIAFNDVDSTIADSKLSVSGTVKGYSRPQSEVGLNLKGRLGPEGVKIATSLASLPKWIKPATGLNLFFSTLTWQNGGKTTFSGKMQIPGGPTIAADVVKTRKDLSIRRLAIKDSDSDANITLNSLQDGFRIGFSGTLSKKTIALALAGNYWLKSSIGGKFQADLYPKNPEKTSCEGQMTLSDLCLPGILPPTATIENATIEAEGKKIAIKSAQATWEGNRFDLSGSIGLTETAYDLNINASTQALDLDRILAAKCIASKPGTKPSPPRIPFRKTVWDKPLMGLIHVKSKHLSFEKINWAPVAANITLGKGTEKIRLTRASSVCGISTPGEVEVSPAGVDIALDLSASGKHLQGSLGCLFAKKPLISGSYDLSGHIEAKSPGQTVIKPICGTGLARLLQGKMEFKAQNGLILRFETFTRIISVLSFSEIYRGVVPDLLGKGCPYKTFQIKGTIKNGKFLLSDSFLDGPSIKMVFSGQVDLVTGKLDVVALVAPQRTLERVVNITPIVGKVLKDAFVTVPVRVSGDIDSPTVTILSPRAIGHELVGVMQRLVKLPFTVFDPFKE
ncbi:MAG: AsmA-like C-terminal domain-containing protein [Syntrophobacteraceae bacterium]